jgi:hypothetical protein
MPQSLAEISVISAGKLHEKNKRDNHRARRDHRENIILCDLCGLCCEKIETQADFTDLFCIFQTPPLP